MQVQGACTFLVMALVLPDHLRLGASPHRHGRACPDHPRLADGPTRSGKGYLLKSWMVGPSPTMTSVGRTPPATPASAAAACARATGLPLWPPWSPLRSLSWPPAHCPSWSGSSRPSTPCGRTHTQRQRRTPEVMDGRPSPTMTSVEHTPPATPARAAAACAGATGLPLWRHGADHEHQRTGGMA